MSKMSYIHYLCENNNRKELLAELGDDTIVDAFLAAHKELKTNKGAEFDVLRDIVKKSIKVAENDIPKAKKEALDI